MNAMSPFAPFSAIESGNFSTAIMSVAPDAIAVEVHANVRLALDLASQSRQQSVRTRTDILEIDFTKEDMPSLESFVAAMEGREAIIKRDRQISSNLIKSLRQKARNKRAYLRPLIDRLGHAVDLALVSWLEVYRDARLEATYEIVSRPQELDGPVMSTDADVKKYFDQFLAA